MDVAMQHERGGERTGAQRALRAMVEVVLLWAALVVALLGVYEVLDELVLARLPPDSRASAGVLRGIAISLTASVATALYVLFRHVPSLRESLCGLSVEYEPGAWSRGVSELRLAEWLLWLRWAAIVVVAGVVVATTTRGNYVADAALVPLWSGVVALVVFNGVLSLLRAEVLASPRVLVLQIAFDAGVLGFMIHHAGGMANPFSSLFVFHAVIASIVLDGAAARKTVRFLVAFVVTLSVLEASGVMAPLCMRGMGQVCAASDPLHLLATGVGVAVLSYGCPLFVLALVTSLQHERARLASAHETVVEEREKLRSIIDCMADVVIFADKEGAVRLHNQAALALWSPGMPADRSLHVCHTSAAWERLLAKVAAPDGFEEHPLLVAQGRSYEATYAPVRGAANQLSGVVMIARDVTERLKQEQVRMRHERLAVVGRMAASLAHEINNPLSAVQVFTQHAQKQLGESHALYAQLGTVRRNADLCVKIVRDLLTYARQRDPERKPTDLRAVVADVARTLRYKADRSGVEVVVVDESAQPVVAHCDCDQLGQVLVNIGLNGVEAMDAGGKLSLRLFAMPVGDVCVEIRDTGSGIPPERIDKVWDAFYTTKPDGTGLGLGVAKGIVDAHGGRIELASELGVGTVFTVVLPTHAPQRESAPFSSTVPDDGLPSAGVLA